MNRIVYTICISIVILAQPLSAQHHGLKSITEGELQAHLEFIASDELEGRETGQPGIDIAAKYLEAQCKLMNMKTFDARQGFLQKIDFTRLKTNKKESQLQVMNRDGDVVFSNDSIIVPMPNVSNTTIEGEVVFAGYGFTDTENGYNAFDEVDVGGKIVMIMSRKPEQFRTEEEMDAFFFSDQAEERKIMNAFMSGAKAVLFVFDPDNAYSNFYDMLGGSYFDESMFLSDRTPPAQPPSFIFITQYTANKILESSGETLADLQKKIDSTSEPASFPIEDMLVSYKITKEKEEVTSYNVVGVVEGTDPELKNECVVYTAHYDHVGLDANGEAFNGADDDGSGTVGLLEIADAFMHLDKKPKRSIVFVWCTAEEKGLYGSEYYTMNPAIPLDKTVSNINLDMIGRVKSPADTGSVVSFKIDVKESDELFVISGHQSSQLKEINEKFFRVLKQFQPFGPENHNPVFLSENVVDNGFGRTVGSNGEHLKLTLIQEENPFKVFPAIAFHQSQVFNKINKGIAFDICYQLVENEFRGKVNLQIQVMDIKFD